MGISSIFNIGKSGADAARVAIATTGHNITNASTEGFSRQRVQTSANQPEVGAARIGPNVIGTGTHVSRIERVNDEYVEKQLRNGQRDLSFFEERDLSLKQVEDVFNEMNGDGLNRLVSRFFNEFRKLSDEPENPAMRQSVRESSQALVNDFKRLRKEVMEIAGHIDSRIEGYCREADATMHELASINDKIRVLEAGKMSPNDLLDDRDRLIKKLGTYFDISVHKDKNGNQNVDLKVGGPLVSGNLVESLFIERSPGDSQGKMDGSFDIRFAGRVNEVITHLIKGGKLGALVELRDSTLGTIVNRLDDLAFTMSEAVNAIHTQGVTAKGAQGIAFFKPLLQKEGAAERIALSDEVLANINNIATGLTPDAPGDNRVAIAISRLQGEKIMNHGHATMDEWYNSIVSDVGVASSRNRFSLNQQKDIMTQLTKVRDQISGVSIDEETTNLLQFQHAFDASAKVVQVADDLLRTVLSLKKD